jgi:hypothetical protein
LVGEARKDFMGIMVAAAMAKLQGGDLNPVALAKALYEMLDGRHLQMAVDDPARHRSWRNGAGMALYSHRARAIISL